MPLYIIHRLKFVRGLNRSVNLLELCCSLYKSNREKAFDTSFLMMMMIDQDHKNDGDGDDAQNCGAW